MNDRNGVIQIDSLLLHYCLNYSIFDRIASLRSSMNLCTHANNEGTILLFCSYHTCYWYMHFKYIISLIICIFIDGDCFIMYWCIQCQMFRTHFIRLIVFINRRILNWNKQSLISLILLINIWMDFASSFVDVVLESTYDLIKIYWGHNIAYLLRDMSILLRFMSILNALRFKAIYISVRLYTIYEEQYIFMS